MKKQYTIALGLGVIVAACAGVYMILSSGEEKKATMITADGVEKPAHIDNFRLHDHLGQSHELQRYMERPGIVLLTHAANGQGFEDAWQTFNAARDQYFTQGFLFFLINSNSFDTLEKIEEQVAELGIEVPVLRDEDQLIAADLGIDRTNEVIVIEPASGDIPYRGAVDGLADALGAMVDGAQPPQYAQAPAGSPVAMTTPIIPPDYATEIAPLIKQKCSGCHVDGGIAPFAFDGHRKVKGWAPMIREVVMTKRMPPWHADPAHGEWDGDVALSVEQRQNLIAWIDAGAPRGDSGDDPLRVVAEESAPATWTMGEPDLVVAFDQPVEVPTEGVLDYVYLEVPIPLDRDRWVSGVEILPGAVEVVHHALTFVKFPPKYSYLQPEYDGGEGGFFAGFVPGSEAKPFPEGTGKFLPRGSSIIFQMHYTAVGKAMNDLTQLGIWFHDETPEHELETRAVVDEDFSIPAGTPNHETHASMYIERDVLLYAMSPHMHYRGSWINYTAKYPNGEEEVLLSVPFYDFNWQRLYEFAEPKAIPGGTEIIVTGAFDNSPMNPYNPDPNTIVTWGEQSWEEMFIGYMLYAETEGNRAMRQIAMRR